VINNLDEIKSYFIGLGTNECANIICDFIWSNDRDFTLNELYLHLSHQYMRIFREIILKLENSEMNFTDLYDIVNDIKIKLEIRIKHNFFGNKANKNL
jgi:formyltetrahydrofolate synthetase